MDDRLTLAEYVPDELIGFGGTGEVWRAHDVVTGETVALKRLRKRSRTATERLRREAALLASVAGPHVIGMRGLIVEAGQAVLVMDYAAGGSLADVLSGRGRLSAPEVVTVLAPIATALAAAHTRDLVHGDLTPANILFTADGRPMLADFGVAQAIGADRPEIEGTLDFLDPAILAGAPLTGATDVFALGAIGYTALTGQTLWGSGTPDQLQARASIGVRAPLEEVAPDAPPALVAVIESALRLEPDERPDPRSMAHAVLRACAAAPVRLVVTPSPRAAPMTDRIRPAVDPDILAASRAAGMPSARRAMWMDRVKRYAVMFVVVSAALLASAVLNFALGHHVVTPMPEFSRPAPMHQHSTTAVALPQPSAVTSTPTTTTAADATDVAPPSTWKALASRLDSLRTKAFATADAGMLASVYAPGAAAYATDSGTIASLASRGLRARGFTATVERVRAESGTATSERLRVVDRLSGYLLVDRAGVVVGHGAARDSRAFTMQLTNVAGTWLIAAVTPA